MKRINITRHHCVLGLLTLWALLFVHVVRAATLNEFMGGYDEQLLHWAAATALLGGAVRTTLSLESDRRVVRDIAATAIWDAFKSLFVGMLAFVVVQAIRSSGVMVPNEIRFTAVLVAGWGRMAAFEWMRKASMEWLEARKAQVVAKPLDEKEKP